MEYKVAVIGLGYVGLPLAIESGKKYPTLGFDINKKRITELNQGKDHTGEVEENEFGKSTYIRFSNDEKDLQDANFYIVTVPTPVDDHKKPDLRPIISASTMVSKFLKKGDIVVYESTVYPGCTEEVAVPLLEKGSGLVYNESFFCGYSPERINPGDKVHRLTTILKITSGSNPDAADRVDHYYKSLIQAGTYKVSGIMVAEAAKVIENAQRDINIAFVNELALIFDRMGLDTREVLEAAGTKWNFLKFQPGLVGGHCIGVDPYYLTYKAEHLGYHPQVILAGRKINDDMGRVVAQRTIKLLSQKKKLNSSSSILVMGITFKENCPDVRNTRVIDIIGELSEYHLRVEIYDPFADPDEVFEEYQLTLQPEMNSGPYDAIILAVGHDYFRKLNWEQIRKETPVIFDVKGLLDKSLTDGRL